MKELWRDIEGIEGYYQISNLGNVKSLPHQIIRKNGWKQTFQERIMKPTEDKDGYLQVVLCVNKIRSTHKISRLVAKNFIPNPFNYPDVNHKDLNKKNNFWDNLEWCTKSENIQHAIKNGVKMGKPRWGKDNPNYRHGRLCGIK